LPGKIRTKNAAVIKPITPRYFLSINAVVISNTPRVISTTPDAMTTKSAFSGSQVGTWAKNSVLFDSRWLMPADSRNAPRPSWARVFIKL